MTPGSNSSAATAATPTSLPRRPVVSPAADRAARRWDRSLVAVAGVVLVAFFSLVAADLNGSSIGMLRNGQHDDDLVAGAPRPIRSDEWIMATPSSVGADRAGLPQTRQLGLTRTDVVLTSHGGASDGWLTVFRPQDWGYVLFSASRGLAWHWWASFALAVIGLFALFRAMRVPVPAAIALTAAGAFSPYTAWWSAPSTALFVGFAGIAVSSAIAAVRAERQASVVTWALLAAWGGACLVAPLYPPWIVSIGLVAAALLVGLTIDEHPSARRILTIAATIIGPLLVVGAIALVQHRSGLRASEATIYPGQRRSSSGDASLQQLLSAPLSPWLSQSGQNVSELSSAWLPLGTTLVAVALLRRRTAKEGRRLERPFQATLIALTAVSCLLLSWALLPLPAFVGKVTLLDRVTPSRLPLALGFLALLWIALAIVHRATARLGEHWLLLVGVATSAAATMWAWNQMDYLSAARPLSVLGSALVLPVGLTVLLVPRFQRLGMVIVVTYCFGVWASVNPLYRGLGALADEPIVGTMEAMRASDPDMRVAVFSDSTEPGSTQLSALVMSSGADTLSATTYYPDVKLMRSVAPGQEALWNNYARYAWKDDPSADVAQLVQITGDFVEMRVNPCGSSARLLDLDVVVSDHELIGYGCLIEERIIPWQSLSKDVYIYRVIAP